MNYLALFNILSFVIFWGIRFKSGVPPSLSADYYRLQAKGKSHYFDIFFSVTGVSMWFYGVYHKYYHAYTLMLLAVAGIFLVVVMLAPFFKIAKVATWHYIGAYGAIGFGFWAVTFQYWSTPVIALIPLALFVGTVILLKVNKVPNFTTWVELAAAGCIFTRLLIKL